MTKLTYFGQVTDGGILKLTNQKGFTADLREFAGKHIRLTIERQTKRSDPQNRFYWGNFITGQIDCFKERFGETYRKEQIHDFNKVNFWGTERVIEQTGEVIKIPESSTIQSKSEWEEKLENIRQWFRQNMDWELPYPLEQSEMEM